MIKIMILNHFSLLEYLIFVFRNVQIADLQQKIVDADQGRNV